MARRPSNCSSQRQWQGNKNDLTPRNFHLRVRENHTRRHGGEGEEGDLLGFQASEFEVLGLCDRHQKSLGKQQAGRSLQRVFRVVGGMNSKLRVAGRESWRGKLW